MKFFFFFSVSGIRRLGRSIISINFKYRYEANWFVENENLLPDGWIGYIPIYKILRMGIVKGVDLSLWSESEIRQGIRFPEGNLEIRSLSRFKYRDKYTMELKNSSTVKIEFASNLLPEYLSIWNVRSKVRAYINRVRKCYNGFRWGVTHLYFLKVKNLVQDVAKTTNQMHVKKEDFHCINCGDSPRILLFLQSHYSFNISCPV